jgi:hypothetical protein
VLIGVETPRQSTISRREGNCKHPEIEEWVTIADAEERVDVG